MADSQAAAEYDPPKRHCAFCLQLKPYKVCTGCRRRAYCSVECQKEDWKSSGKGQGHKNWCKIEHGQEDVDWEVRPITGKGLGIVAKRLIPAKYWIIVEGLHFNPDSHSAIADLAPEGGSLEDKFKFNSKEMGGVEPFVLLRTSRLNHSCSPNAEVVYCETSKVAIVYASRDIQEGSEICHTYLPIYYWVANPIFRSVAPDCHLDFVKQTLNRFYGFTCSAECVCYDPEFKRNVTKFSKLYATFRKQVDSESKVAMKTGEKIIALLNDKLYAPYGTKAYFHGECRQAAMYTEEIDITRAGFNHAKKAGEMYSEIMPLSRKIKDYVKGSNLLQRLWGAPLPHEVASGRRSPSEPILANLAEMYEAMQLKNFDSFPAMPVSRIDSQGSAL